MLVRVCRNKNFHVLLMGVEIDTNAMEGNLSISFKITIYVLIDPFFSRSLSYRSHTYLTTQTQGYYSIACNGKRLERT